MAVVSEEIAPIHVLRRSKKSEHVAVVSFDQLQLVTETAGAPVSHWRAPDKAKGIRTVRFSPDGNLLAVVTDLDKRVWILSLPELEVRGSVEFPKRLTECTWTIDSQRLCIADKVGDCFCVEVASLPADVKDVGKTLILGHLGAITGLVMDSTGRYLVTCDRDEKIRVSHFPNAYNIRAFGLGHRDFITSIHLFTDSFIVSASSDRTLASWSFPDAHRIDTLQLPGCPEDCLPVIVMLDVDDQSSTIACRLEIGERAQVLFIRCRADGTFDNDSTTVVDVAQPVLAGLFSSDGKSFFASISQFPKTHLIEFTKSADDQPWAATESLSALPAAIDAQQFLPVAYKPHIDLQFELSPLRFQKFDQLKQPNSKKPANKKPRQFVQRK